MSKLKELIPVLQLYQIVTNLLGLCIGVLSLIIGLIGLILTILR